MAQHLVLTLLFPPLLLYGTPAGVARRLIRPVWVRRVAAVVTRPFVAAALFTAPIALWHPPVLYEAALRPPPLPIVQHLVFLTTAVLMWCPVLSPVPELPRLHYAGQMLYLFLLGIPMSLVGALITLADQVLYPFYAAAPRVFGLPPLADQQIGGVMVWGPRGLIFWLAITGGWFPWSARGPEKTAEPLPPPPPPPRGAS